MTLDEAIKHCEEKAKDQRWQAEVWEKNSDYLNTATECLACAEEHKQLAEWLKELKALKEAPKGDLISREALKSGAEKFVLKKLANGLSFVDLLTDDVIDKVRAFIDNAPTVSDRYAEGYAQGYIDGSTGADWKGGAE